MAVKSTSVDELSDVSKESCSTPTINPTPTTFIAISFGMPNKLHAKGMSNNEPPATPIKKVNEKSWEESNGAKGALKARNIEIYELSSEQLCEEYYLSKSNIKRIIRNEKSAS